MHCWREWKMGHLCGKLYVFPRKIKHRITDMTQRLHLWVQARKDWKQNPEEMFAAPAHSSSIHRSQEMEMTQVSLSR